MIKYSIRNKINVKVQIIRKQNIFSLFKKLKPNKIQRLYATICVTQLLRFAFQKNIINHTLKHLLTITFVLLPFFSFSQKKITHLLEGGALVGAEIARNTGDFKYAPNLRYTFLYAATSRLQFGGGLAYEKFKKETLLPLYADAHVYLRESVNSPFFAAQAGYALGWHSDYQKLEQYEYHGGLMLGFDYGQRLSISDNLKAHISLGLRFQTPRIEVDVAYLDEYIERVNYVMMALKMGIAF